MKFVKFLNRYNRDEDGATAIEYGLFAALIAAVIVVAVSDIGTELSSTFGTVKNCIDTDTEGCEAPAQ